MSGSNFILLLLSKSVALFSLVLFKLKWTFGGSRFCRINCFPLVTGQLFPFKILAFAVVAAVVVFIVVVVVIVVVVGVVVVVVVDKVKAMHFLLLLMLFCFNGF